MDKRAGDFPGPLGISGAFLASWAGAAARDYAAGLARECRSAPLAGRGRKIWRNLELRGLGPG